MLARIRVKSDTNIVHAKSPRKGALRCYTTGVRFEWGATALTS